MQIHNGDLTTCMGYYNQDELQNTIGTLMSDTICDNEINAENAIPVSYTHLTLPTKA